MPSVGHICNGWGHPDGNIYALINIAEDVQDLTIDMVGKPLRHTNPYMDLTDADNPARCFIEMQNEDDCQGPPRQRFSWQVPSMVPHYNNLRSDYLVGYIDRHSYFGADLFDTMLSRPGSDLTGT